MKVLIVEDETKLSSFVQRGLQECGIESDVAFDGVMGKKMALNNEYDAIVLDINLPEMSGYEVCKEIRKKNKKIPVLMLTGLDTIEDKIEGFDSGTDDYLLKPFEFRELLARLRAMIKRAAQSDSPNGNLLSFDDLEMNLDTKVVKRGEKIIKLTAKEFTLLEYMMRNKGRVLSKVDIAEKIWDITFDTGTNVIEVYINFLRNKIDKGFDSKLIHTVVGMGYVLRKA